MKNRSKKYFALANQYLESSKLLMKTILSNENNSCGAGFSEEDAINDFSKNVLRSDAFLLIPALFLGYQSVELYTKGLLIIKSIPIDKIHEVTKYYDSLKQCYGEHSDIYMAINRFYSTQIQILKEFKAINNITTITELYEALRYPEDNEKRYDHSNLKYNGEKVINQIEKIINQMNLIGKKANEYWEEFSES